jgi:hypothetical protein
MFRNLRLAFSASSVVLTYTAPSFSTTSYFAMGSSAGASSTSPVETLKQAMDVSLDQVMHVAYGCYLRAMGMSNVPLASIHPSLKARRNVCSLHW